VADPRPHEPARVAANLLDPGQSDITPSPPPADRPAPTADTDVRGGVRRRPLQTPLLLLGLLTVFAEWQYTRRQSAR
jgi:hypothetical protein